MADNNTTKIIKNIRIGQETYDIISDTVVNMINNLEAQLVEINATKANASHTHTTSEISDLTENLLDLTYPIGAIYLSVNSTSPASLFGGTWEQIEDRFLLASGSTYSAGDTGGEAEHTLTIDEMPSHTHTYQTTAWVNKTGDIVDKSNTEYIDYEINRQTWATGGSQPHNNMPPYLVVYMYKRVE